RRFGCAFESILKSADPFAEALAEFGYFLGPEHQHADGEDDQQMHWLEQAFKHRSPSVSHNSGRCAAPHRYIRRTGRETGLVAGIFRTNADRRGCKRAVRKGLA